MGFQLKDSNQVFISKRKLDTLHSALAKMPIILNDLGNRLMILEQNLAYLKQSNQDYSGLEAELIQSYERYNIILSALLEAGVIQIQNVANTEAVTEATTNRENNSENVVNLFNGH